MRGFPMAFWVLAALAGRAAGVARIDWWSALLLVSWSSIGRNFVDRTLATSEVAESRGGLQPVAHVTLRDDREFGPVG